MSSEVTNPVLYMEGTFDKKDPTELEIEAMIAAAQSINKMGYETVILGLWHMWEDGSFFYNNTPFNDVLNRLQVIITALTMGGGTVKNVLISFGGWGSGPDYAHAIANKDQFQGFIRSLNAMAGLNGVDFDYEPSDFIYESSVADFIVEMTEWLNSNNMIATAAPYTDMAFWTGILSRTNTNSTTGFSWWNLQNGEDNYEAWVTGLSGLVPEPQSFLIPGWNAGGSTPGNVQTQLSTLKASSSQLNGAFIWQYELANDNKHTAVEYYNAIALALSGGTKRPD